MGSWRDTAAPIIADVIQREGRGDIKKLRAALCDAYPFGQRKHHPYKVWCDEVRRQVGTLPSNKHQRDLFAPTGVER